MSEPVAPGALFLVATPIGNLADMSQRALATLKAADCIACEDTRHSRKLCAHYGIATPLVSYYRERERERAAGLLKRLLAGQNVALISDAGMPGISDPGAVLARLAREAGITVRAIPGPSALTTALALAGLEESTFYFAGFLPATQQARLRALRDLATLPCPLVFYEAPHRIRATLADLLAVLGDRPARLFRELTKLHEEHLFGTLAELAERTANGVKGELVLIVDGRRAASADADEFVPLLRRLRAEGLSLKDAANVAAQTLGLPRNQSYRAALELWRGNQEENNAAL